MAFTEKDKEFIAHEIPEPFNTPERYEEFIRPRLQTHETLCTATIGEINNLLKPLNMENKDRFFCRIDVFHKSKSPASIIEKIMRHEGKYTIKNFLQNMTDLARFRIVCNFLDDLNRVVEAIKNSEKIQNKFVVNGPESTINQRPQERKSGERSVKFVLEYKSSPGLFLEIQIMTILEEAWDKKDHFLIYEKKRRTPDKDEENFPGHEDTKMFAMAELLYIADDYFNELKNLIEKDKLNGDKK